jgi:uncharacterized protein DUF6582/Mu-like prophage I protein
LQEEKEEAAAVLVMPWDVVKDTNVCPVNKPWAVKTKGTGALKGCHESRDKAIQQQRALYKNVPEGRKMNEGLSILTPMQFAEEIDDLLWVEALPAKVWHTTEFGEVDVTLETLQRMVDNFYGNVRGQEVATDYEHGRDVSKGNKASGWIREANINDGSLWLGIKPTETAMKEIKDGEWKYFSLEWDDWMHPETEEVHKDVILGGGFTNRPIAKGLVPINFSELFDVTAKEFAAKNKTPKKPYGNVTYADPGYQKDGKKRYPLDTEAHIRAAWSYINMPKNAAKYSSSQVASIKGKIRAAMKRIGAQLSKKGSEMTDEEAEETLNEDVKEVDVEVVDESKEMEHSEPGSGSPPEPRTDEDGSDDKAIREGWRRDQPPIVKELENDMDLEAKLREMLGLGEDADIIKAVGDMKGEVEPLRDAAKAMAEKKAFAEAYPDEFKQLQHLQKVNRENEAKAFAERFTKFPESQKGFSTVVQDKLVEVHKAFSEGTATTADLSELMETIGSDKGIVDFSETGSSRTNDNKIDGHPAKAFAEKVVEIQEADKLDYRDAVAEAAKRHPEMFEAYRKSPVVEQPREVY